MSSRIKDEAVTSAVASAIHGCASETRAAVAVERAARPLSSPLHRFFEWDNTKAALAHRLEQAGRLIRAVVVVIPTTHQEVRAFVSLEADRGKSAQSYRAIRPVLDAKATRLALVTQAAQELARWAQKYRALGLVELEAAFVVSDRLTERLAAGKIKEAS